MSKNQKSDSVQQVVDITRKQWLTPRDVEREFNINRGTLANWRTAKVRRGPRFHKLGLRKVAYRRADVEDWAGSRPILTMDSL